MKAANVIILFVSCPAMLQCEDRIINLFLPYFSHILVFVPPKLQTNNSVAIPLFSHSFVLSVIINTFSLNLDYSLLLW